MGKQAIGKTKGGFNTKIHMICTDENNPVIFSLSPGNAGDAPCGRELIKKLGKQKKQRYLLMDKAYEGDDTRFLAQSLNFKPVVPPKSNRKIPWNFDEVYNLISYFRQKNCNDDFVIYTGYYPNEVENYVEKLKKFKNIVIKFGRFIPKSASVFDKILGVKLASKNQFAEKIS
jgi:hypothetical protein